MAVFERRKRSIEVAFPELPEDSHSYERSWRDGLHSDWKLVLGSTTYSVHKVIAGMGDRCSLFLAAAFRKPFGEASETNLSHTLPETCWRHFESVLDYIYDSDVELTSSNWAPLFKIADVMQIRSLHQICAKNINGVINADNAISIVGSANQVELGEEICKQVRTLAVDVLVLLPLLSLSKMILVDLSADALPQKRAIVQLLPDILKQDRIKVSSEDEVFDLVWRIVGHCGDIDAERLWASVRLPQLSAKCLMRAADVECITKLQLAWAIACRGHSAAPIRPVPEGVCFQGPRTSCYRFQFLVAHPLRFSPGENVYSPWWPLNGYFSCNLKVFPHGMSPGDQELGIFFSFQGPAREWQLEEVSYAFSIVNVVGDVREMKVKRSFSATMGRVGVKNGFLNCKDMTKDSGWLNSVGELCLELSLDLTGCREFATG